MFTGIFIPDAVYRYSPLSAIAKLLYGRLCKFKGERGDAYPAAITLAQELGISERQVFDHLQRLEENAFIERESRPGTSTVYHLLWHSCFEEGNEVVRETALPGKEGDQCGKPQGCSAENRTTGSAENRVRSESIEVSQGNELLPPIVPLSKTKTESETESKPEDLNLEDDIITFVENAYSRENRRAKLDKLRTRQGESISENIRRADTNWGTEDFRAALLAYLSDHSDWLKDNRWPIHTFLKQVKNYIPTSPQIAPPASSGNCHANAAPSGGGNTLPAPTEASERPVSGVSAPQLPFAAQEWNRVVTAGQPVEQWSARFDRGFDSVLNDAEFQAALPKVLKLCQTAFEVQKGEADWLSFRYILGEKRKGVPNWHRMATGEFNWLRKKRTPRTRHEQVNDAIAKALAKVGGKRI
jgi:hypothetical protein